MLNTVQLAYHDIIYNEYLLTFTRNINFLILSVWITYDIELYQTESFIKKHEKEMS